MVTSEDADADADADAEADVGSDDAEKVDASETAGEE
jgi:hypothetical protein